MFLPKSFTEAVNGSIHWGANEKASFGKKARHLPDAVPNGVLRYSSTGKGGTFVKGKRLGAVGLALVEGQKVAARRQERKDLASFKKAFETPKSTPERTARMDAAAAMARIHKGA